MPMLRGAVNIFRVGLPVASHRVELGTHSFPQVDNY